MKCPHCEYKEGWDSETSEVINGDEWKFYKLPIKMERESLHMFDRDEQNVYGCPNCKKIFIEKD